ncbi:MAG: PQQ-binding-like beta-propeller repeat protein, partial [Bacteroidetes bacterium]|nr:PQQ-binding-like beta-propeller repeat protein [Bacteroidota bacterium]
MNKALIVVMIVMIVMHLDAGAQKVPADCWPSYRGDARLTGISGAVIRPPLKLLWTFKAGDAIKSSAVIFKGNIYIGCDDGCLYAITVKGKLLWKFKAGASIEAPPLLLNGRVYAGSLEGVIYALDAVSGALIWKYVTDGQVSGSCNWTLGPDKKQVRIIVGSYDFNLHCIDALTGRGIWQYNTGNYINGTPSIAGD